VTTRAFRLVLWTLVVVAAIAATVVFFTRPNIVNGPGGGQFALVDQRGNPVDQSIFVGKPTLLFFGYTHCPDVCPTTMGEMQGWFSALGDEAKTLQGVFVTVDPERDTATRMRAYVRAFSPDAVGLTGTPAQIAEVTDAYHVYFRKVPTDGGYLVDHSTVLYLIGPDGTFLGHYGRKLPEQEVATQVAQTLQAQR